MNKIILSIVLSTGTLMVPAFGASKTIKERIAEHELILYYRNTCPFCKTVMTVLKQLNIPVIYKDISKDRAAKAELIKRGGKQQVPCLSIDGVPLYESKDIVKWLKERYT